MLQISVQDLRRIVASLEALKGKDVVDVHLRSDLRQLKLDLADGTMLVVAAALDDAGHPHLEVDVVRVPDESLTHQLEVGFESR
jgi:hypothetical protein